MAYNNLSVSSNLFISNIYIYIAIYLVNLYNCKQPESLSKEYIFECTYFKTQHFFLLFFFFLFVWGGGGMEMLILFKILIEVTMIILFCTSVYTVFYISSKFY